MGLLYLLPVINEQEINWLAYLSSLLFFNNSNNIRVKGDDDNDDRKG
jgi:hypothetical protein